MAEHDHQGSAPASPPVRPGALSALLQELVRPGANERASSWERALRPGAVVGRFELVRELGRGGFGIVYEARDRQLGRSVAFKALRGDLQPGLAEERLAREAELAARLTHPNLVTLHDVGRAEGGPYLVLELLRGETLARRLERERIPFVEALRIGVEVAKGLAHAHAHGVVHRDLTPGNVFLCEDGQVKVLDLGMAYAFGHRKLEGGTPAYMAPEQRRAAPEDERTDVFALGVLLYRMLADEPPFTEEGGSPSTRAAQKAPPLETPAAPALGPLVGQLLAVDPVQRPRDAGEVAAALGALQRRIGAPPPSTGHTPARRGRRPRRMLAAIAGACAVAGAAGAIAVLRSTSTDPRVARPASIAVLPFADLSPGRDQQFFADGLAQELRDALAQVEGLRVAGRTSSSSFREKEEDVRSFGEKLGVAAVVEGSVRRVGTRVRVTAQVVGTDDGFDLWSRSYDREVSDIFAVQEEIARAVVEALRVDVLPGREPTTEEHRTASAEAYEQYLLGRQLALRYTDEGFRAARRAFEKAVALDPAYAPAWAGLALAVGSTTWDARDRLAEERRSIALADKAVALGPELAAGWAVRGALRAVRWDWAGAEGDLSRALALGPGNAEVQLTYGELLSRLGRRAEALAATRRAVSLDPLSAAAWTSLAWVSAASGLLEQARDAARRAAELAPGAHLPMFTLAFVALREGRPEAALELSRGFTNEVARRIVTAMAEHDLGRAAESQRALDEAIATRGAEHPVPIAAVYAWRGELDRAFEWLERGYALHDDLLPNVKDGPFFGNLKGDPRYAALLRRMDLPAD